MTGDQWPSSLLRLPLIPAPALKPWAFLLASLPGIPFAQGFILETPIISRGSVLIFPTYKMSGSRIPAREIFCLVSLLPLPSAGEPNVLTLEGLREAGAGANAILSRWGWQLGTTFPQLALCRGNSMTETRQLVAGSLRFEDEDAVSAVPRRATRTNADAHFFPEDLLERECLGTWGQRFLYQ